MENQNETGKNIDEQDLVDELQNIQDSINEGKGLGCLETIIVYLKDGDIDSAKATCYNESDKLENYPEAWRLLKENLFQGEESHPWYLLEKLEGKKKGIF